MHGAPHSGHSRFSLQKCQKPLPQINNRQKGGWASRNKPSPRHSSQPLHSVSPVLCAWHVPPSACNVLSPVDARVLRLFHVPSNGNVLPSACDVPRQCNVLPSACDVLLNGPYFPLPIASHTNATCFRLPATSSLMGRASVCLSRHRPTQCTSVCLRRPAFRASVCLQRPVPRPGPLSIARLNCERTVLYPCLPQSGTHNAATLRSLAPSQTSRHRRAPVASPHKSMRAAKRPHSAGCALPLTLNVLCHGRIRYVGFFESS